MNEFYISLSALEKFYLFAAIAGGVVFIIRFGLALIGMDHDADFDVATGVDGDIDLDHGDSDASFQVLSVQSISAFVLMFGMVGLTFTQIFPGVMEFMSILPAAVAGVITVWIIVKLMSLLYGLQSSGTMDVKNAIGAEGTVYLNIPEGGCGKVQVSFQNRLVEFDAVSQDGSELKTGTHIRVVFMKGDNLVVEKA